MRKRKAMLIVSTFSLMVCLVVASYAWYSQANNGNLAFEIPTNVSDAITFSFTPYSDLDGTLVPAKMKNSVINNLLKDENGNYIVGGTGADSNKYFDYNGNRIFIPNGDDVLPKVKTYPEKAAVPYYYQYDLDTSLDETGNPKNYLQSNSNYLDTPATILYRQFRLQVTSSTELRKQALFTLDMQYFDINNKQKDLMQDNAIAFYFYVCNKQLDNNTLSTISTVRNKDASKKKTISEMFYTQSENPTGYIKTNDTKVISETYRDGTTKTKVYYEFTKVLSPDLNTLQNGNTYYELNSSANVMSLSKDESIDQYKEYYTKTKLNLLEGTSLIDDSDKTYYEDYVVRFYNFKEDSQKKDTYLLLNDEPEEWNQNNAKNYRVVPKSTFDNGKIYYSLALSGLGSYQNYYIITVVHYYVPDELLDGNLWITKQLNINISYKIS